MLLILLFLLIVLAGIALCVNGKDYLSPPFVLIVFFIVGTAFAFYGNLNWKIELHDSRFILAILGGLASILFGGVLAQGNARNNSVNAQTKKINYNYVGFLLLVLVNVLIVYLYYKRVYEIAVATGFSDENMQMYVRAATSNYGAKLGLFFTFFIWIVQSTAIVCAYVLINNVFEKKRIVTKDLLLLVPIVLYFIQIFFSGSRAGLIRFFIILFFFVVFSYRRVFKKINPLKMLFTALIALSVLLYAFAWLGTFTKKVDEADFLNPVCIYVGSSIIALDDWFQRDKVFSANQLGEGSFYGLYMLANFFQGDLIKNASSESNFIRKGTFSTNIYTGFCSYLNEYGWPGLFIICVMLGLIFQYGYQYVVNNPKPLYVMIYGYFFIDFLYLLFAPSITSNLFTPTSIMGLVWIVIVFKFLARTKELNG